MPAIDPQSRKWTTLIWKLFVVISVLLIICLLELQVILAANHASNAGKDAHAIASCVNKVLRTRNAPNQLDQAAHATFARSQRTFAAASKAWVDSLHNVLGQQRGSTAQATAYGQFVEESKLYDAATAAYVEASAAYQRQLEADQALRNQHPLGQC